MHSSLGAYTKGLGPGLLLVDIAYMIVCIPILLSISVLGLRKQEK
jgi:ribosome-dependent ATPase